MAIASRRAVFGLMVLGFVFAAPRAAEAQLDPLLFLKRSVPFLTTNTYRAHVLVAMDTSARMQYDADGSYYDPYDYTAGNLWDMSLGINGAASKFRRKYEAFQFTASGFPKYQTSTITAVGNQSSQLAAYNAFYARTRLGVAKAGVLQGIAENTKSARFGLIAMRQANARVPSPLNDGEVQDNDVGQSFPTDGSGPGLWKVTRAVVDANNGSAPAGTPLVKSDTLSANTDIATILNRALTASGALLPAGNDGPSAIDAPLAHMLDDVRTEASRLIAADTQCRNTVAVVIVGGGEGNTATPSTTAAAVASTFLNISSHRVPIYVIAIAPPSADVAALESIATNSGGRYFQVDKAEIDAATAAGKPAPTVVRAMNAAVQHGFANPSDVNAAPTASLPYGPQSEFQVTSPIIGTVNLKGAQALDGSTLPDTDIVSSESLAKIPQRANVMVTSGFALPGFDMRLRAFRVYKPVTDATKPTGFKFSADGTPLWVAQSPMNGYCNDASASCRNIFTALPNGSMIAFTEANASALEPYMNTWDVPGLIRFVRTQPLGPIVSSTPAFMDPPSLDPPPDAEYPGFVADHEERRTLIFVGANDGMMHAIDGRTGVEVWAFIPFNLLPKLRALRDGQAIDAFDYFVDSSAKVADVRISDKWRTVAVFGEGAGGTFYQAFDTSLDGIESSISPDSDSVTTLLGYFSDPSRMPFLWAFPRYSKFDASISTTAAPYGDLDTSASADEKTVGQTWSDPAVGQIKSASGKYAIITGSGFLPRSVETGSTRGGISAGRSLYLLSAEDGTLFDRKESSPASDPDAETDDNCAAASYGCTKIKNALQADPVATGPMDQRFVTKSYIGDLDGNIWRYDITLDGSNTPQFTGLPTKLYGAGADQPIFSSMAAVAIGTQEYVFVGTGSDLLPSTGVSTQYKLLGVLDTGTSGTKTFEIALSKTDGAGDDEKVSAFPAVAGDIVFFTTTSYKPTTPCILPDANLYALTFVGGAAYDGTGDNKVSKNESPKVRMLAGAGRATAPFIVDQHLAFGAGGKIEMFGDPNDFNNGVGNVGVRILSWRDIR
jgi:Neisseria PilC beta-propeller domain